MEPLQNDVERHTQVELAAYYLWEQRGGPIGNPEVDWFRAEAEAGTQAADAVIEPAVITVAAVVGSALGSVAGLVASVSHLIRSDPSESE